MEELARGLEQTRTRFRPDEDWWKKYIQKEVGKSVGRLLERTGKRYVRHHPLIDYNYIETKEVSKNDEESAKRSSVRLVL